MIVDLFTDTGARVGCSCDQAEMQAIFRRAIRNIFRLIVDKGLNIIYQDAKL